MPLRQYAMAPMDVTVADTQRYQRELEGRQHQMEQNVMAVHRQLAFDPNMPGTSRQYAHSQHQGSSPVNQFRSLKEFMEGNEPRSQTVLEYDKDAEDNDKILQDFLASSSRNHSGAEEKGVEDLVKEFRNVGEKMTRRNSGPSAEQPIQPPSISPLTNHTPGARPSQHPRSQTVIEDVEDAEDNDKIQFFFIFVNFSL